MEWSAGHGGQMSSSWPRVLIIGWDGADWSLLGPLLDEGHLPNLAALAARGVAAPLRSTRPPVTGPAWASFATGLHPGHHGLLSWQLPLDEHFQRAWVDSRTVGRPCLWDWLTRAGLRSGVIGLPVTYPVAPLNGIMISGMLTPGLESPFIHPPELAAEFRASFPAYPFDVDLQDVERDVVSLPGIRRYLAEVGAALRQRAGAVKWLWEQGPYDCVVVVFETPDRLQHPFYQFVSGRPASPRADWQTARELVLGVYRELDAALGTLLERVDLAQTTVLMASDHGFGPLRRDFYLTNWLVEAGYAAYAEARVATRALLARAIRPFKRLLPASWLRGGRASFAAYRQLDWSRTVAYPGLSTEEGVWINVRGREPAGVVEPGAQYERLRDEIGQALLALRDPLDGQPVITAIWRREELYDEPFCRRAADLVFRMADGYRVVTERGEGALTADRERLGKGIHRDRGLFLAAGRGVAPGRLREEGQGRRVGESPLITGYVPHLVDVVPTALACLGVPVASQGLQGAEALDGRVLYEILPGLAGEPTRGQEVEPEISAADAGAAPAYSDAEAEVVRRRLAALGYLD